MLQIFPFLAWIAPIASAVILGVLWNLGDLQPRGLALLLSWFLLAGYCQFFSGSLIVGAVGLLLQTMLTIYLIVRLRISG